MPRWIPRSFALAPICTLGLLLALAPAAGAQARPDLLVSALAGPPATGLPGDSFIVSPTVVNQGTAAAAASATKLFLVSTTGPVRKNLKGVQSVPALGVGASDAAPVTVSIYSDTPPGKYYLQACADGFGVLLESNEINNCKTTDATIDVLEVPDLVVTVLGNPPASAAQGQSFSVTSSVQNIGAVAAAASTTKFHLISLADGTRTNLKGTQAVPILGPGDPPFTETTLVTVKPETPPGQHRLQACSDATKVVAEEDDRNNCLTSGVVTVIARPDLVVTPVTVVGAPLAVGPGATFPIDATVVNQGSASAGACTLKFQLVNTVTGATKNLSGTRSVGALAVGATEPGQTTVKVYADTAFGTYAVRACIDSLKVVAEGSEGNNCTDAPGTVTVQDMSAFQPDLVVDALTDPPATGLPGDSFSVTATVTNTGGGAAVASTTRFYMVGPTPGPNGGPPIRKNLKGVQSVGELAAGASASPAATVEIYSDTVPGTYTLEACADGPDLLAEASESNNCLPAATTLSVVEVPDLAMEAMSNPPETVVAGGGFTVDYTVRNIGPVAAPASNAKLYLVPVGGGARIDLRGTQAVPSLLPNEPFSDVQHAVTVRPETAVGEYRLQGCADSAKVIVEGDEDNNCFLSDTTVDVTGLADLTVASVEVPGAPLVLDPGTSFSVTATVSNAGTGTAGPSATRFQLVRKFVAAPPVALTGTQAVPSVAGGASQAPAATVTIPAGTPAALYAVQACADSANAVAEISDANNCGTSVGTVGVR